VLLELVQELELEQVAVQLQMDSVMLAMVQVLMQMLRTPARVQLQMDSVLLVLVEELMQLRRGSVLPVVSEKAPV